MKAVNERNVFAVKQQPKIDTIKEEQTKDDWRMSFPFDDNLMTSTYHQRKEQEIAVSHLLEPATRGLGVTAADSLVLNIIIWHDVCLRAFGHSSQFLMSSSSSLQQLYSITITITIYSQAINNEGTQETPWRQGSSGKESEPSK